MLKLSDNVEILQQYDKILALWWNMDLAFRRYAVYYVPREGSQLANFGDKWLGWSLIDGDFIERLNGPLIPADLTKLTQAPQRYGFHGTLMAPIRLGVGFGQTAFINSVRQLAKKQKPFDLPNLKVSVRDHFLALELSEPCAQLHELAATFVTNLHSMRRPPSETEIAKRMRAKLSDRQLELLKTWGYPYVLDEFRFHMTLTGKLEIEKLTSMKPALKTLLNPLLKQAIQVTDVAVVGESETGMFHLIERVELGN